MESIFNLFFAAIALATSISVFILFMLDRKRNEWKMEKYYDHFQRLTSDFMRNLDYTNDRSNMRKKGFSDEYEENTFLLRRLKSDLSSIRIEMRNLSENNLSNFRLENLTNEIANKISLDLADKFDATNLSQAIIYEISNQMSVDHFKELKSFNFENKVQNTYRTIQHIQHILRTPVSGLKINIKTLRDQQLIDCPQKDNICTQMENAIALIESNLRTLNYYSENTENSDQKNLKGQINNYINLFLLTLDKQLNLNLDGIDDNILLPCNTVDDTILCLSCLVENASYFAQDNSEIKIDCDNNVNSYSISVTNYGAIIEDSDRIFEDGFSTKEGSGSGIGLYLAKIIVQDKLNGDLTFTNLKEKNGVKFTLTLEVT